ANITPKIPPADGQELVDNILRRIEVLLGDLPQAQIMARERTIKAQKCQKECHDQRYPIESYFIGDKLWRSLGLGQCE
ncbi:23761_t:CDS:2, partial [Dentiscutata erythropus]